MSESKFTPGPWMLSDYAGFGVNIWNKAGDKCIAERVRLKDASLIAAAPDMYEALKLALAVIDHSEHATGVERDAYDLIEMAISKAKGQAWP